VDRIQVTKEVHDALKDEFLLVRRGQVFVKGAGIQTTYFLLRRRPTSVKQRLEHTLAEYSPNRTVAYSV